ncbi:hypothetical protein GA0115252_17026 [Streptomyces sp. DfronAA-171]|nr:hypothetical protein GA0115252_17026 [Streptomyces sp. DfronAA-171]
MERDLEHEPVERQRPRVVRDEQRGPVGRHVLQALHLDTEVLLVQGPQRLQEHALGQLGVVPEVVDLVRAREPPPQEGEPAREPPLPLRPGPRLPARRARQFAHLRLAAVPPLAAPLAGAIVVERDHFRVGHGAGLLRSR